MNVWDVIVIGVGAVGSFALREASRRGARALGLELAEPAHARGSSHGHCRIFRHAYFEHPDYVPLLRYATRGFEELERERSVQLLHRCGVLLLGKRDSMILSRSLLAARTHGLPVADLDARDVAQRFPWFASPLAERGVLEQDAGLVRPELAIAAAVASARSAGAEVRLCTRAITLRADAHGVEVATENGTERARSVVVAAGAWAAKLLPELRPHLTVTRQVQTWVAPQPGGSQDGMPCWLLDLGDDARSLYGIPADPLADAQSPARFPKVAWHGSNDVVDPDVGAMPPSEHDTGPLLAAYARAAAPLAGRIQDAATCLYTMSTDGDFLVGRSRESERIHFAAGLSGHGFKLAPALGRALCDLALIGHTELPIGFLSPDRFATRGNENDHE
jgi:sarcosine oxidase